MLPIDCGYAYMGIPNCNVDFAVEPASASCADGPQGYRNAMASVLGAAGSLFSVKVTLQAGQWGGWDGSGPGDRVNVCAFLEWTPPAEEKVQTAATGQLVLGVRAPRYSLQLTVPKHAVVGPHVPVTVATTFEAPGALAVQVLPRGYRSCRSTGREPLDVPALNLIPDHRVKAGSSVTHYRIKPRAAGTYLFCGWIEPDVGSSITVQRKQVVTAPAQREAQTLGAPANRAPSLGERSNRSSLRRAAGPRIAEGVTAHPRVERCR
jgi:hypothetical protein